MASVQAVLARHPEVPLAVLFGSVARGTAGPRSDLAVAGRRPLSTDERIKLVLALRILQR